MHEDFQISLLHLHIYYQVLKDIKRIKVLKHSILNTLLFEGLTMDIGEGGFDTDRE